MQPSFVRQQSCPLGVLEGKHMNEYSKRGLPLDRLQSQSSDESGYVHSPSVLESSQNPLDSEVLLPPSPAVSQAGGVPQSTLMSFRKVGDFSLAFTHSHGHSAESEGNSEPSADCSGATAPVSQDASAAFVTGKLENPSSTEEKPPAQNVGDLKDRVEVLEVRLKAEIENKKKLQEEVSKEKAEKTKLEEDMYHMQRDWELNVRSLEGKLQEKTCKLEEYKKQLAANEQAMAVMREEHAKAVDKVEKELGQLKLEHEAQTVEYQESQAKVEELKKIQDEAEKDKIRFELELEKSKRCYDNKISELNIKLMQSEMSLAKKEKEVAEKESAIQTLKASIDQKAREEAERALEKHRRDSTAQITMLQEERSDCKAEIVKLKEKIDELEKQSFQES